MAIKWIDLLEEANELGFDSIEEATDGGYEITYLNGRNHLIKRKGE